MAKAHSFQMNRKKHSPILVIYQRGLANQKGNTGLTIMFRSYFFKISNSFRNRIVSVMLNDNNSFLLNYIIIRQKFSVSCTKIL